MYTTILIMLISINGNSATSVQVSFQSDKLCQQAKADIERQVMIERRIISSGCYEQGRTN